MLPPSSTKERHSQSNESFVLSKAASLQISEIGARVGQHCAYLLERHGELDVDVVVENRRGKVLEFLPAQVGFRKLATRMSRGDAHREQLIFIP